MKRLITKLLLKVLNSPFLNGTPNKYMRANGFDAVSYEELKNEVKMNPHKLVRDMIWDIDKMRSCQVLEHHVHTIGGIRPINEQDIKDLQNL